VGEGRGQDGEEEDCAREVGNVREEWGGGEEGERESEAGGWVRADVECYVGVAGGVGGDGGGCVGGGRSVDTV
jgi:hypothetical protein